MAESVRLTMKGAEAHGHLEVIELDGQGGDNFLGECTTGPDGSRCWTFAPTMTMESTGRQFLQHAAERLGICWRCSQPAAPGDRPNGDDCPSCWYLRQVDEDVPIRDWVEFPKEVPVDG